VTSANKPAGRAVISFHQSQLLTKTISNAIVETSPSTYFVVMLAIGVAEATFDSISGGGGGPPSFPLDADLLGPPELAGRDAPWW